MDTWRKYQKLITRDMVIKAIESSDNIATDGKDKRFLIWEDKQYIPAKKLLRRAAELAFPDAEIDWNGAGGDPTVEILTPLGFEVKARSQIGMADNQGEICSINDSVWLAAAVISYEKYFGTEMCRNITDFALMQAEIRNRAKEINGFEPEAARTRQWCCGDHDNHTYAYLRAVEAKRRLSFKDEFLGEKCEPDGIDKNVVIETKEGSVAIQKIYDFVHTEFAKMEDQVIKQVNIDYIGVLDYLRDNQEVPYSNPDAEGIDEQEKARLLAVKEKGQAAVGEMKKMAIECQKMYKLDKCLPISWLDGSNTKTRKYLWAQMKYSQYTNDPTSISIFVEKNGENSSRYRISLELKNDGTDKKTVARFHSYLDMPIDFSTGFVMASGSNEGEPPRVINDTQENVKAQVEAGKIRKVQLCKYIERKPDETNEYFHTEFLKAVGLLIPYYEHVLEIKPIEWWPSKDEYDPGLTIEQWVEILNDTEITTGNNLRMFAEWLDYGKPAACSEIAEHYGEIKNFFNAGSSAMAKRIVDKEKCPAPPYRDNENARWWPVIYVGRDAEKQEKGSYIWKLRDEVKRALEQIELPEIEQAIEMSNKNKFNVNTILYGPPGTGKTYYSTIYAVAICDGKSLDEFTDYDAVVERFEELKAQHRVAFTTFHQSYGYEEFIEGIKPVVDSNNADITYSIEPGVFKKFCENAKVVQDDDIEYTGTVWMYKNRGRDKDVASDHEDTLYSEGVIKVEDITDYKRQCNFLVDMTPGDWVVMGRNYSINAIGVVADDLPEEIMDGVFHYQRSVKWKATGLDIDCRAINRGKGFSNFAVAKSGMKVRDLQKLLDGDTKNEQPYVFIIDEINRGNISKIFGELITLIESTKREGMPEEANAILPYSGEPFSVPSNVYILGTMNTADRSIALMDTALRRRFDFEEMMPDPKVIEGITVSADGETLDVAKMLRAINTRIEYLYDREHTIGHAFFTGLRNNNSMERLSEIFRNKVIPLLQEYFYEDYEKIQLVLGENDKSSDAYKFILDKKVNENDIFKKSPQLDLHEKTYEIQKSAFDKIRSYIEITETRKTED